MLLLKNPNDAQLASMSMLASKMAAISWVQDGMSHIGIFIQHSFYF